MDAGSAACSSPVAAGERNIPCRYQIGRNLHEGGDYRNAESNPKPCPGIYIGRYEHVTTATPKQTTPGKTSCCV